MASDEMMVEVGTSSQDACMAERLLFAHLLASPKVDNAFDQSPDVEGGHASMRMGVERGAYLRFEPVYMVNFERLANRTVNVGSKSDKIVGRRSRLAKGLPSLEDTENVCWAIRSSVR